ncbi:hypothetical protein [Flavobacterium algicola]|uniref:hypothetical protein n=1 Tax=Flavobacterium algicola TaxID=556529 RepID=UPI001EFEB1D6|nr:hypothetical protein [Flavobacterium algicola]MCG9793477.1 hypothetical protein [Flavobacterium algicola]
MLDKEVIKSHIKKNIRLFNPLDFCNNGGWATFDELEIVVISDVENAQGNQVKVSILYSCEYPASCSCFEGNSKPDSLNKEIFISKDGTFEVLT